jgi:hypothetical protein
MQEAAGKIAQTKKDYPENSYSLYLQYPKVRTR